MSSRSKQRKRTVIHGSPLLGNYWSYSLGRRFKIEHAALRMGREYARSCGTRIGTLVPITTITRGRDQIIIQHAPFGYEHVLPEIIVLPDVGWLRRNWNLAVFYFWRAVNSCDLRRTSPE